jgi:hypothetical protein
MHSGPTKGDNLESPLRLPAFTIVSEPGQIGHRSNHVADLPAKSSLRKSEPHRTTSEAGVRFDGGSSVDGLSFRRIWHTATSPVKNTDIPKAPRMKLFGLDGETMGALKIHVGRESLEGAAGSLTDIANGRDCTNRKSNARQ